MVLLILLNGTCSCGRVVKASDSKSDSLWERRFESYQLRMIFFNQVIFIVIFYSCYHFSHLLLEYEYFMDLNPSSLIAENNTYHSYEIKRVSFSVVCFKVVYEAIK